MFLSRYRVFLCKKKPDFQFNIENERNSKSSLKYFESFDERKMVRDGFIPVRAYKSTNWPCPVVKDKRLFEDSLINWLTGCRMELSVRKKRRIAGKQKRRCLRTGIDIPLGHVYFGKNNLLLRLCFADPMKLHAYMAFLALSLVFPWLRGFGSSPRMVACEATRELTAQLAVFPLASDSIPRGA